MFFFFYFFSLTFSTTVITWPELQNRSPDSVCQLYQSQYVFSKTKACFTTTGATECIVGTQSQEDIQGTTKRLNFFREMVGLPKTTTSTDAACLKSQMESCMIMDVNNYFGHYITEKLKCFTVAGQTGAAKSNIYKTSGSACSTDAITAYMDDTSVDSLGHRRWLIYPPLSESCMGVSQHYSAQRVMNVGYANTFAPRFIAYPPPGPVPADLIYRYWSFNRQFNRTSLKVHNMPEDAKVFVRCNCTEKSVAQSLLDETYTVGYPGIAKFDVGTLKAGTFCDVVIKSASLDTEWKYTVNAINCVNGKAVNVNPNPKCGGGDDDSWIDGGNSQGGGGGLTAGGKAGLSIGIIAVIALAIGGCYFYYVKVYEPNHRAEDEGGDAAKDKPQANEP